jgi:hypothetical protein
MFTLGSGTIVFYGYEVDAEVAAMTYETLFSIGTKGANNYYQNKRNEAQRNGEYFRGTGLKNTFLIGYLEGIKAELEKQSEALMVIVPGEVDKAYQKRTAGFSSRNTSLHYRPSEEAREKGRTLGKNSVRRNRLESATV